MRPIPIKLRNELAKEPRMKKCYICETNREIEWNHALIYQGRQINEPYAIIALCKYHHRGNNGTIFKYVKDKCEAIAISTGLEHLKINYPKRNWEQEIKRLNYDSAKR